MQILLNEAEIIAALDAYVRSQLVVADGCTIATDLRAGRGENGYTATLDIIPPPAGSQPTNQPAPTPAPAYTAPTFVPRNDTTEASQEAQVDDEEEDDEEEVVESSEEIEEESPRPKSIFNRNPQSQAS